jgi:hypothetical protein
MRMHCAYRGRVSLNNGSGLRAKLVAAAVAARTKAVSVRWSRSASATNQSLAAHSPAVTRVAPDASYKDCIALSMADHDVSVDGDSSSGVGLAPGSAAGISYGADPWSAAAAWGDLWDRAKSGSSYS